MAAPAPIHPPGDPTAVVGRRIGAYLIDLAILAALVAIFVVSGLLNAIDRDTYATSSIAQDRCEAINRESYRRVEGGVRRDGETVFRPGVFLKLDREPVCLPIGRTTWVSSAHDITSAFNRANIVTFVTALGNWVILQGLAGGSIGKLAVGLRVVRGDGRLAGLGWNALRTVLLVVDNLCFFVVGLITATTSRGHRRVGDMAASTFVVRRSQVGRPVAVPGLTAGPFPNTAPYTGPPAVGSDPPATGSTPSGWPTPPVAAAPWTPEPNEPVTVAGSTTTPPVADPTVVAPSPGGGTDATQVTPTADGPTWDPARKAYIQYDPARGAWIQFDDATQAWGPISQ